MNSYFSCILSKVSKFCTKYSQPIFPGLTEKMQNIFGKPAANVKEIRLRGVIVYTVIYSRFRVNVVVRKGKHQ